MKELQKRGATVRWVDEFRTSKMCSSCHHENAPFKQTDTFTCKQLVKLLETGHRGALTEWKRSGSKFPTAAMSDHWSTDNVRERCPNMFRRLSKPWGVRVCINCHTLHERNINACRNMLYLTAYCALGAARPLSYTRVGTTKSVNVTTQDVTHRQPKNPDSASASGVIDLLLESSATSISNDLPPVPSALYPKVSDDVVLQNCSNIFPSTLPRIPKMD